MKQLAELEVAKAQQKVRHEQRLCETYSRQYESIVQLVSFDEDSRWPLIV